MSSGQKEEMVMKPPVDSFYCIPCMCVLSLNELCVQDSVRVMKRTMACSIALLLLEDLIWWFDTSRVGERPDGGEGWGQPAHTHKKSEREMFSTKSCPLPSDCRQENSAYFNISSHFVLCFDL